MPGVSGRDSTYKNDLETIKNCNMNLANGYMIPDIGFGTFQTPDGEVCVNAVREAIAVGYTHIDTAAIYQNEVSVGEGVRQSGKVL